MTKSTFDLVLLEAAALFVVFGGVGIWARQRLTVGPSEGVLHGTAKIAAAVTQP